MSAERARYNPEDAEPLANIENKEIEYLEEPIFIILEKLRESIENGDYGTIIGDDASGRIPALIIGKFLNSYNAKHGLGKVETLFLAGSGSKPKREVAHFIKGDDIKSYLETRDLEKDVLIVTDTISSGNSLKPLTLALKRMGKKYDIASVGNQVMNENSIGEYLGTKPIYGELVLEKRSCRDDQSTCRDT